MACCKILTLELNGKYGGVERRASNHTPKMLRKGGLTEGNATPLRHHEEKCIGHDAELKCVTSLVPLAERRFISIAQSNPPRPQQAQNVESSVSRQNQRLQKLVGCWNEQLDDGDNNGPINHGKFSSPTASTGKRYIYNVLFSPDPDEPDEFFARHVVDPHPAVEVFQALSGHSTHTQMRNVKREEA